MFTSTLSSQTIQTILHLCLLWDHSRMGLFVLTDTGICNIVDGEADVTSASPSTILQMPSR